jgi:hypothetical protein
LPNDRTCEPSRLSFAVGDLSGADRNSELVQHKTANDLEAHE